MNRRDTAESIREKIAMLRDRVPGIILRSTVIVGFPGETSRDFDLLLQALAEMRFDRLGCFVFSPEEGTPAADMHPRVRRDVADRRYARVMALQQEISLQANLARIGSTVRVSLDSITEDGLFYSGRSAGEAPDVDPVVLVALSDADPGLGVMADVRIVAATEYDMTGVTV
jgi:ribosomal protein S12 methylthiotransferase